MSYAYALFSIYDGLNPENFSISSQFPLYVSVLQENVCMCILKLFCYLLCLRCCFIFLFTSVRNLTKVLLKFICTSYRIIQQYIGNITRILIIKCTCMLYELFNRIEAYLDEFCKSSHKNTCRVKMCAAIAGTRDLYVHKIYH